MNDSIKNLIENYKTPERAVELISKTRVILLVGISGAGKDTLLTQLLKTDRYHYIISHTTRNPRENKGVLEKDGVDYHFISQNQAEQMLKDDEFVEAKFYSGNVYGTSIKEFESAQNEKRIAITDIEVQGVSEYMKISQTVTPIFVLPPSFDTWQNRLNSRYVGEELDKRDLELRFKTAISELKEALSKDYYQFVVNDEIPRAVEAILQISDGNVSDSKNIQAKNLANELLLSLEKFA